MTRKWETGMAAMVLLTASGVAQPAVRDSDWKALQSVHPGSHVSVKLRDGKFIHGQWKAWSAHSIEVAYNRTSKALIAEDVHRVSVQQKGSRWKSAMWGALIGFGVAFPIGAASAGHLTDRNDPGFATRVGMGTGLGMFGAGIAAPIGALTGGKKYVAVYRAPDPPKKDRR